MRYAYGGSRCYRAPAFPIAQHLLPAERPAANPPGAVAVVDGWKRKTDGQTDAQSLHRPCSAYADSVNKTALSEKRSGKIIFETVAMCGKTRLLVKYFQRFLSKPHYPQFRSRLDHTSVIGRLTAISRDCRLISVFAEMSVTRQTEHL